MNNKRNAVKGTFAALAMHALAAFFCTVAVAAIMLSVFSIIMCNVDIPLFMIVPFATISASAAAMTAAAVLAFLEGSKGVIYGIATGLVIFLALWAASAIGGTYSLTGLAALKLIAYCSAGCVGGIIGVSLKEKKLKHR